LFEDLAKQAPSSAGFYFDKDGALTVVVRDSVDFLKAEVAVSQYLASGRLGPVRNTSVRVKQGRFTFRQLAAWRDVAFDRLLLANHDIASLDLDEVNNRVTVGVRPTALAGGRQQLLATLHTNAVDTESVRLVPQELVERSDGRAALLRSTRTRAVMPPYALNYFFDTIVGGIEIRNPNTGGTGTLGVVATRNGTTQGFLTASHVVPVQRECDSWGGDLMHGGGFVG
jgi:hypothetical protein